MTNRTALLEEYLVANREPTFDWELSNCCHFACRWVELLTGTDLMLGLRSTPSEFAARKLLAELGGTLDQVWTKTLGEAAAISPTLAQVGDVVMIPMEDKAGAAVGICSGMDVICVAETGRLARIPISLGTHAWKIGRK